MTIKAQISSDTLAEAEGIEIHTGSPVLSLCRRLLDAGYASSTPLEAYRGDVLCLSIRSIGEAAGLRVVDGRLQPAPEPGLAPPMSSIQPSSLAA